MSRQIRVVLSADHMTVREGLCRIIKEQADLEVVGEAADGREAVTLALERSPDIVLMDVSMPVMDGIEATRRIAAEAPGIKVLGLSMHADGKLVREMLQAGASGYVLKDRANKELADAIRAVMMGRTYLSPEIAGAVPADHAGRPSIRPGAVPRQGDKMATVEVGMRIRGLREEQGLTSSQLGEHLKMGENQIVRLENGENPITTKMLLRIAEALDVRPIRFFENWTGESQFASEVICPECGHRFVAQLRMHHGRKRAF